MSDRKPRHQGHRARMRQRMKETSPAAFADHELFEMLLYHTNARGDTNETAHTLIEAFGSVEGVLDADADRLKTVWGIGESAAFLITVAGELARRYTVEKFTEKQTAKPVLDSPDKIAAFLLPRFLGAQTELAYALLLDNSMRPIDCVPVGDGTVSLVSVPVRTIVERAYTKHAAGVVLAHNHPGGTAIPSNEDIQLTLRLKEALQTMELSLVEHYVFSDSAYSPILNGFVKKEQLQFTASPLFDKIKNNFYK